MALTLLPDIEILVVDFFLAQPEIAAFFTADTPHDRVYTVLPKTKTWPLVRVTRYGGLPVTSPALRLDAPTVQIEAFGGPKKTAHDLAQTCRAAMAERLPGAHPEGFVTGVTFGAFADLPDATFEPARPRFLFTSTIYVHPPAQTGS